MPFVAMLGNSRGFLSGRRIEEPFGGVAGAGRAEANAKKTGGRFRTVANYIPMEVESDQSDSPDPISEADFVRLFARHELALRNYARLVLPDWGSVDDVLQDASITMWENRKRLRDESGFLPWGKVIVRHKCFNAIAKMRRERLFLDKNVLELIAREEEAEAESGRLDPYSGGVIGVSRRTQPAAP